MRKEAKDEKVNSRISKSPVIDVIPTELGNPFGRACYRDVFPNGKMLTQVSSSGPRGSQVAMATRLMEKERARA